MKFKALYSFVSAVLLTAFFASCTDEVQELANEQSQALKQIVMTTQDFQPEADSRTVYQIADGAVKCTWAENDTVGVFPNEGAQAYFPMASGVGTKNATFDGKGWALKDGYTYASYYPYIGNAYLDRNAVPVSYTGQTQVGNGSMAHLGDYDYMVATPTAPEFGSAQFMFKHLSALMQLKITVPQPATFTSVKLVTDIQAFAVKGKVDIMAKAPVVTPTAPANEVVLNLQDVATTKENEVVTCYLMLPPADLSGKTLKAVLVGDKGTQEIALESKNFKAGTAYALSGTWETEDSTGDGSYKNGVVSLAEAGTMKKLLGKDYLSITSLKVVGPINGDDVYYLRKMLGGDNFDKPDWGKLTTLDLSDARIVEGGGWYDDSSSVKYYTANDVIGHHMFYQCANLKEITLPDGVTSIGNDVFRYCSSLISVNISKNVTSIGDCAFFCCSSLTSIDIPDAVTSIGSYVFTGCSSLISIDIPDGVTSISDRAFWDCDALTSVTIGKGVVSIGYMAFEDCDALTSIDIPDSVTSIGDDAFEGCDALTTVTIGNGVTSVGSSAFYYCFSLSSVYIKDLSAWCIIRFSGSSSNPLCYGAKLYLDNKEVTELVIPEEIKEIEHYAFLRCKSIVKVVIPDGVTSIGSSAFNNCDALTSITIGDGVTSIGNNTFDGCSALTTITIGDGITSIGYSAFNNCKVLTDFYCHATTPPSIYQYNSYYASFPTYGDKTTLHVPERCRSTYKSSKWGDNFKNIVEMD